MRRIGEETSAPSVPMKDAAFPSPFSSGLEFSAPARGCWTIVHVGMLVPEAHEIFVCAAGCLRGVVLSAVEMNVTDRFSTVAVEEHNVLDGDMEELIIEGVSDILHRLASLPRAVLLYSSCIHQFMGCDFEMCCRILRKRFPSVDFIDCYMNPTMRKSGLTPDQMMRRQLYGLLKPAEKEEKHCAVVGNCFPLDESCDLLKLLRASGWTVHQIADCESYEEYQETAKCTLCISTQSAAEVGGEALARRLNMRHLYLPVSYGADEIRRNLSALAEALGVSYDGVGAEQSAADAALQSARLLIGSTPIAVDYTLTPRPLGLVRLLLQNGFRVKWLFTDFFSGEEKDDYLWLQKNAPEMTVCPTVHAGMRRFSRVGSEKALALGQKAAYFTDSPFFVNLTENGGLYGFDGIRRLAELMKDAFEIPKDVEKTISIKGLGCVSCL